MVMILKLGYKINFNYFADVIAPMKSMLYLLIISNIFLIIVDVTSRKNKVVSK